MIRVYDNNIFYVGNVKDNKREGKCTMYYLSDTVAPHKIFGTWVNDKLDGVAYRYDLNSISRGTYVNGKKNGTFIEKKANIVVTKCYFDDILDGANKSRMVFPPNEFLSFGKISDGDTIYIGDIKNGKPDGYGVLYQHKKNKSTVSSIALFSEGQFQKNLIRSLNDIVKQ